jgi:multidrug efflux pump subunit AcrA (membrane-fusion protein)
VNSRGGAGQKVELRPVSRGWYGSGIAIAGLLVLVLPKRKKYSGLLLGMIFVGALGLSGCSSTPSAPTAPSITPTPAGTYTVTVDATGSVNGISTTQSTTVTLVVQ